MIYPSYHFHTTIAEETQLTNSNPLEPKLGILFEALMWNNNTFDNTVFYCKAFTQKSYVVVIARERHDPAFRWYAMDIL